MAEERKTIKIRIECESAEVAERIRLAIVSGLLGEIDTIDYAVVNLNEE